MKTMTESDSVWHLCHKENTQILKFLKNFNKEILELRILKFWISKETLWQISKCSRQNYFKGKSISKYSIIIIMTVRHKLADIMANDYASQAHISLTLEKFNSEKESIF